MSKDSLLNLSSNKRNKNIFPTRISSKIPVKLSSHSRNNSYEGQQLYKSEKSHNNDISAINSNTTNSKNLKNESQSSSYYSFFSSEKEPSNMSNSSFEYNESVTMAVLNLDCYSKLNNSSKESSDFDNDNLNKILNNDKTYTLESYINDSNNIINLNDYDDDMIFSPDETPINILDKPSYIKVDTSRSILFNNSDISIDNSKYPYTEKRQILLKNSRNSSLGRKPSMNNYDDYPNYNDIRSSSLPRDNIDIHPLNNRARSNTLPNSNKNNTYSIQDIEPVNPIEYERRNNYNLYDDDNDSFVYNQSEFIPNYMKVKNNDIPDSSSEERRYRSLSRRHENYRSPSKNGDRSDGKGKSRSKSRSKSKLERQNSQNERSLSRNRKNSKDDENRFHSLSRSRKNSKDNDESRYRSLSRNRKDSRDDERVEKERKRSTSRHKKCHKRNKSSSNHNSPLVKSSPIIRNNNHGSPLVRGNSLARKNSRESNIDGSPLIRNNSRSSNNGSPLVRKESYRSPLASNNVINNKFSTDYIIHNDYSKSPNNSKKYQNIESPYKNNNNEYHDDYRNNNNKQPTIKTIGETQDLDIINEICDLKKFSQDFSGLNILESILNKPIEDDFEFLNYNRIPEKKFNNQKFSTLSRLQTKHNKTNELIRRNSLDFNKGHNRTKSEQIRNEDNNNNNSHKGSKRNFFNFFSHKKSKSYSNSSDKEESDFDKMIKGNETIKIKLQPTNKFGLSYMEKPINDYHNNDSYYDSGNHNEEYNSSYKNFLKEKQMNQQQKAYNQPMNYNNYTPLFKVSMINKNNIHNHYDNMEFYGAKTERTNNPYDQFNSFSTDESDKNFINIGNRNASLNRYNKFGGKKIMY